VCLCVCVFVSVCVRICSPQIWWQLLQLFTSYCRIFISCCSTGGMCSSANTHIRTRSPSHTHIHIHNHTHIKFAAQAGTHHVGAIGEWDTQGGEDSLDDLSCRPFSAKEPLIIGLFRDKMNHIDKASYDSTPPCIMLQNVFMTRFAT